MTDLWILTEERPKSSAIETIALEYAKLSGRSIRIAVTQIAPIFADGLFSFEYQVRGITIENVGLIRIRVVSGKSSFVDFLVYESEQPPLPLDIPFMIVEETKTDDSESRNVGISQRASKFVYADFFYPEVPKYMYYNYQIETSETRTDTFVFGARCLLTIGVKFLGGVKMSSDLKEFETVDELIDTKNAMASPRSNKNVPIRITRMGDDIEISGKLLNQGGLHYDPNIGGLTLISASLRALGHRGKITITRHALEQNMVGSRNKFVRIANRHNIELSGLAVPRVEPLVDYWKYEVNGEKLGSIFLHLLIDYFADNQATVVYENHAGCERGYFFDSGGRPQTVEKSIKKRKILLPDLVIRDELRRRIWLVEGEMSQNYQSGLRQLEGFKAFEDEYCQKYYPGYEINRAICTYGEVPNRTPDDTLLILNLTPSGQTFIPSSAPDFVISSLENARNHD